MPKKFPVPGRREFVSTSPECLGNPSQSNAETGRKRRYSLYFPGDQGIKPRDGFAVDSLLRHFPRARPGTLWSGTDAPWKVPRRCPPARPRRVLSPAEARSKRRPTVMTVPPKLQPPDRHPQPGVFGSIPFKAWVRRFKQPVPSRFLPQTCPIDEANSCYHGSRDNKLSRHRRGNAGLSWGLRRRDGDSIGIRWAMVLVTN